MKKALSKPGFSFLEKFCHKGNRTEQTNKGCHGNLLLFQVATNKECFKYDA